MVALQVDAHASELPAKVFEVISDIRRDDPLGSVIVWCPGGEAARSLSRALTRRHAMFDVEFTKTSRVARRLLHATGVQVDGRSMNEVVAAELVRKIAAEASGPLEGANSPRVRDQIGRALRELRTATFDDLTSFVDLPGVAPELVRLYARYLEEAEGWVDTTDFIRLATDAVIETATELPAVVRIKLDQENPVEEGLAVALERAGRLTTVVVGGTPAETPEAYKRLTVATDPAMEAQLVVSTILEWAAGGANFGDMVVVSPRHATYAGEIEFALDDAGIPWRSNEAHGALGGALVGFVDALGTYLTSRREVDDLLALMSAAPLTLDPPNEDSSAVRRPAPVTGWLPMVRAARSGGSMARLLERLDGTHVAEAREFMAQLHKDVGPEHNDWAGWSQWMTRVIDTYFDASVVDADQYDMQRTRIDVLLRSLTELDDFAMPVDVDTFVHAVRTGLWRAGRRHSDGASVFVCSTFEARGVVADNVIIWGLSGNAQRSPSPIVDAVRAPGAPDPVERESATLLGLVAGAERVSVSFARSDTSVGREVAPSPLLLRLASLWAGGQAVSSDDVIEGRFDWVCRPASFSAAVNEGAVSVSPRVDRLRALGGKPGTEQLATLAGVDARSIEATVARQASDMTAFDGNAGPSELPRSMSPTRLEHYAVCPRRYFFATTLGIGSDDDEPEPWMMSAIDKGVLVHDVLEKFTIKHAHRVADGGPWPDDARRDALHMIETALEKALQRGKTPDGLLFENTVVALQDQVLELLETDDRKRAETGLVPSADRVEQAFGGEGQASAVVVDLGNGRQARFSGRIDRIDKTPSGDAVRVVDYKTGKAEGTSKPHEADITAKGRQLQLSVYASHAASANPGAKVTTGLWFIREPKQLEFEWTAERAERFEQVVRTVATSIESGAFPAIPGEDGRKPGQYANCQFCPYDSVCPADRADAWARKAGDPVNVHIASLHADVEAGEQFE